MTEAVLSLGANLGDRFENLRRAIDALSRLPKTKVSAVSRFYETEPFKVETEQQNYINCCVRLETGLEPESLLGACLGIEAAMGKIRLCRNGPRCIDLDLLLYGEERRCGHDLMLPHPRISERAFVLVPLKDLYPDGRAPGFCFSMLLSELDTSGVWAAKDPADNKNPANGGEESVL